MKKLITTLLFLIPFIGFAQTSVKDTLVNKAKVAVVVKVNNQDQELDEEYIERPFQGKEEKVKVTRYIGMTDHEMYNAKLKEKSKPIKTN